MTAIASVYLRTERRTDGPWLVKTGPGLYAGITPDGRAETDRAGREDAIEYATRDGAWSASVRTGGKVVPVKDAACSDSSGRERSEP